MNEIQVMRNTISTLSKELLHTKLLLNSLVKSLTSVEADGSTILPLPTLDDFIKAEEKLLNESQERAHKAAKITVPKSGIILPNGKS